MRNGQANGRLFVCGNANKYESKGNTKRKKFRDYRKKKKKTGLKRRVGKRKTGKERRLFDVFFMVKTVPANFHNNRHKLQ